MCDGATTHEVSSDTGAWSPGDMIISLLIQFQLQLIPGAAVPLDAAATGPHSATHEPQVLQNVIMSFPRKLGE